MALRASYLIGHALKGFNFTLDEAIELIRNTDGLSERDRARRNVIIAAIDNLVDFAVAEEYQMLEDYLEELETDEDENGDDDELSDDDPYPIFRTYNLRYASVENLDVEYAMAVAAGLVDVRPTTLLTYMTQGDERVRPWHLQYEGYTYPKSSFPEWLIPPIEHMCRCYLVEDTLDAKMPVVAGKKLEIPDWFNPTFKESVAMGGRIFSDEHPYFKIAPEHNSTLQNIAARIKSKYFNGN